LLNEFILYVLEDLHSSQSLGALKFTSADGAADPAFVKETVERVYRTLPFDSCNGNRPRDASDKGLLAAACCLQVRHHDRGLPSHRSVLQVQRLQPEDFRRLR
jgi:hypothetical protein